MIQRQGGEATLVDIISEGGFFQGDLAPGVYFNAGLQNAFDKLRQEYPQATLVKYLNDLNGSVKSNETVSTNEPRRAKAKPDAYKNKEDSREATTVPMATAILLRWEYLVLTMCGLEASPKKRGVCSMQSTLKTKDHYYSIPIIGGLKVGGIPIGKDKYVITKIAKIITENVEKVYQSNRQTRKITIQTRIECQLWRHITSTTLMADGQSFANRRGNINSRLTYGRGNQEFIGKNRAK
jgi:hypothetical protein